MCALYLTPPRLSPRDMAVGCVLVSLLACGQSASPTTPVAAVVVTPPLASVEAGGAAAEVALTATPQDVNGAPLPGRVVNWSSSDPAVATVSGSGFVTGIGPGSATITATSGGQYGTSAVTVTPPTPLFAHVFLLVEENHGYKDVIGISSAPYLNGLASQYSLATQYYADAHPSIGNYFMMTVGKLVTDNDSYTGTVTDDNIVRRLVAAGKTWKSYAEDIPSVGYLGSGFGTLYARRHNPFTYFSDVVNDPVQQQNLVPFTQLAVDLANDALPDYAFLVPNRCDDAHDCPLATADAWLLQNIDPLIKSPQFQQGGLLIITFDEAHDTDINGGGGRVAWIAVSSKTKPAFQSAATFQHESTLRLTARALGLTTFPGAATAARGMGEFFQP